MLTVSAIVVVPPLVIQAIRVRTTRWPTASTPLLTHFRGLYRGSSIESEHEPGILTGSIRTDTTGAIY
jgi:hypothetical protein